MKSVDLLKKNNLNNLISISKLLKKFEHFIFYGTLLGMIRDHGIINGDDDVDILVNIKFKKKIIKLLKEQEYFKINKKKSNFYFIQLTNKMNKIKTFVDLYFYIDDPKKNYIIEKHNFLSSINLPSHFLHIPKIMIFPIKKSKKYFNINLPKKPKQLCKFLYGEQWLTPMKKNSGYRMEIVNHKPKLIKRSLVGSFTRNIKLMINNKFKKK